MSPFWKKFVTKGEAGKALENVSLSKVAVKASGGPC